MTNNKKIKLGMFLLMGILLMVSVSAAVSYSRSTIQYIPPTSSSNYLNKQGIILTQSFSEDACKAGQDFVVQISPLGCEPTVVRSDLLEEQNTPVFCQLSATKINPLIDVEAIESVSFKGDYPKEVSGVGFHPANAGIKTSQSTLLNSPVLNNIGYAVIVLKKQPNESAMPDWVQGNMTAKIKYDVKNAFGIGSGTYYLPQINDEDWNLKYKQYGFWQGKGFLKAEDIGTDRATVAIYKDKENKLTSVGLEKGKTSGKINIPGFYCLASLQLRLDGLVVPDTRVKFEIDGETAEVIKGEKFLDNKCSVRSFDKKGLYQTVKVYCSTDEGGKNFDFKIAPKVRLNLYNEEKDYELGEEITGGTDIFHTYVGYIGAKKASGNKVINTNKKEDLIVYYYKSKTNFGDKLSDSKLLEISKAVESKLKKPKDLEELKIITLKDGGELTPVKFGKGSHDLPTSVVGFAGAQDKSFAEGVEDNYKKAIKDFDDIIGSYSSLKFNEDEKLKDMSYGEVAFFEKIKLANKAGQKASAVGFCEKFKERYPESSYWNDLGDECSEEYMFASSGSASWDVLINGEVKSIRFKGVYEPSQEEYSAEVSIGGEPYTLTKNEIVNIGDSSVQLTSLDDDYANVQVNYLNKEGNSVPKTFKLKENVGEIFGSEGKTNTIVLTKINLEKQAKVSVIPSIDNTGTEANFTFKIGIEKRAIQLSPEKINEKIKNLNETIEKWEKISGDLGNVVKGMKGACITTAGFLIVKNFFTGFSGKAAARQDVTGWYRDKCKADGRGGTTKEMQSCLLDYNDAINTGVGELAEVNTNREKLGDKLAEGYDKEGKLKTPNEFLDGVDNSFEGKVGDKDVVIDEATMKKIKDEYLVSDNNREYLKKIKYYQEMRNKGEIFKDKADEELAKLWKEVGEEYNRFSLVSSTQSQLDKANIDLRTTSYGDKDSIEGKYYGKVISNDKIEGVGLKSGKSSAVEIITFKGKKYAVLLDGSGGSYAPSYYKYEGIENGKIKISELDKDDKIAEGFSKFVLVDPKSYENKYEEPKVFYYGAGPYNGQPQIVPVDVDKGFYAATTEGVDKVGGYESSAMPKFFFLCNVMGNGKQEFGEGKDDECVSVRVGSNQADAELTGLGLEKTNEWARKAISVLRDVSKQYKAGITSVKIGNKKIPVGNPAFGAGTQCEDFMSPVDCALMFNVCDPVVCPESRCDFGGKYRVSNVVQSGIIGSTLLCLPNFGSPSEGGVVIPVCLTGIHAGIDSLLSIYKNYGDCLQENLDSGKTVGVCDEIHSIYLCEFFWKQAIPISKLVMSKLTDFIFGGSKGGGEYLQVGEAFDNSAKSIDYMTNYYGANSFAAFKARSTDEVGTEVCKNFISARYPASGDFFDALIEPDSPSQYHAWFHETTFTTATVPPTSQYKVFYHIYAGKDSGVYYSVYLKSPEGSSFYADAPRVSVDSGYIARGDYASATKDFLEVSGYKELCINVQGQEECGFKEVSTSFALDYLQDEYVKNQAERTDIKSEKECISGSASLYNALTPNVQAGAEAVINPEIYNQGISRVCATSNPGQATDSQRWIRVGTCGGDIYCWLDKDSVGEAVVFNESLKGLEQTTEDALEKLREEGNYMSEAEFDKLIKDIGEANNNEKIKLIDGGFSRAYWNRDKAKLLFLKAKAYVGLVLDFIEGNKGVGAEKPIAATSENVNVEKDKKEESEVKIKKTCGDCDKIIGSCDEICVDESNLICEDVEKFWLPDQCVEREISEEERTEPVLPTAMLISSRNVKCFEDEKLKDAITKYKTNDISESLIKAIILQESNCKNEMHPDGVSFGYMGISEIAAEDVDKEKLFENNLWKNVDNNINLGTTYYKKLQEDYGFTDKKLTLMAYNWGVGNVNKACLKKTWESCSEIPDNVLTHVSNILGFEEELKQ